MARQTYIMHNGKLILKSENGELTEEYMNIPRHNDSIWQGFGKDDLGTKGILNHADGKMYDSKSRYNSAVRNAGCRVVGNDYNKAEYKTPLERGLAGDFNVRPQLRSAIEKVMK